MLIAREKRKTNIAEYILYIWQLEDLLRALHFDLKKIGETLVAHFDTNEETRLEIYQWYKNMVVMMQKEQLAETGHIQVIKNLTDELNHFHLRLLQASNDSAYRTLYQLAQPLINEFRLKSNEIESHDIQVALHALYSMMLLKLQQKELTTSTANAMKHISKLMGHLAGRYREYEEGDFEI
ncbi:DUF4924 family protein [Gaoshiqia sp. Z1-71]|uniref:DUF4924 family protein n=1 Tax=Gaoshiqia hydrogeniformans TaxID=3290090 RepID=UPI003BF90179